MFDIAVIGGGIVGLATARAAALGRPGARIVVLDKEPAPARHQTGRNSGVVHSGIYYPPGSLKARMCLAGSRSMVEFARANDVAVEITGKLIAATEISEIPRLDALYQRGLEHGLPVTRLGAAEVREHEPHLAAHRRGARRQHGDRGLRGRVRAPGRPGPGLGVGDPHLHRGPGTAAFRRRPAPDHLHRRRRGPRRGELRRAALRPGGRVLRRALRRPDRAVPGRVLRAASRGHPPGEGAHLPGAGPGLPVPGRPPDPEASTAGSTPAPTPCWPWPGRATAGATWTSASCGAR